MQSKFVGGSPHTPMQGKEECYGKIGMVGKIKRLLCSKQSGLVLDLSDANAVLARIVEILKENRGEINLPDIELEALARAFLPDILAFFSSPEGKAEYEAWQKEATLKTESDRKETA